MATHTAQNESYCAGGVATPSGKLVQASAKSSLAQARETRPKVGRGRGAPAQEAQAAGLGWALTAQWRTLRSISSILASAIVAGRGGRQPSPEPARPPSPPTAL